MENSQIKNLLEILKDYFVAREDVVFAFIFGSAVGGRGIFRASRV